MEMTEERVNGLENWSRVAVQSEPQRNKTLQGVGGECVERNRATGNLWENTKTSNICLNGISEGYLCRKSKFEEKMAENVPNLVKSINVQIKKLYQPQRVNSKKPMPRHIIIKLLKMKHKLKILKAIREKQCITYRRIMIGITSDFLSETMEGELLPWWRSACQCRGHGFNPWSGKIPHAAEQLGLCATTTKPVL